MSFLENRLNLTEYTRFLEFRESLPEGRREAFTGFVCRILLANADRIHPEKGGKPPIF